jgi:putative holliday junction resolvase
MRVMGLDIGSKRIGVAVSDELQITAQGHSSLTRIALEQDIRQLLEIARHYEVKEIVVGLPKNMDGSIGKSAQEVLDFVHAMEQASPTPMALWDERLSTMAVSRTLIEGNVSRRGRKKVVDKLAAVYILQGYLDTKRQAT